MKSDFAMLMYRDNLVMALVVLRLAYLTTPI